jgi:hypothetical protein
MTWQQPLKWHTCAAADVWVTVQALERMEEMEAPCTSADDEAAGPDASLLVEGHISDILKPDVYLSADKKFVTYVNERINVGSPLYLSPPLCLPFLSERDSCDSWVNPNGKSIYHLSFPNGES